MNRIKTKKLCTWRLACELKANRRDSHCPLPARAQVVRTLLWRFESFPSSPTPNSVGAWGETSVCLEVPTGVRKSEFFTSDTHANLQSNTCIHGLLKCKINNRSLIIITNKEKKKANLILLYFCFCFASSHRNVDKKRLRWNENQAV